MKKMNVGVALHGDPQNGITLIALIITIIVMLILVGVTINVALNGGLFDKAKTATFETEMAQIQEQITIAKAVKIADNDNTEVSWSDLDLPQELKTKYQTKLVILGGKLYYDPTQITSAQEQAKYEAIGITEYIVTPEEPTEPETPLDAISEGTDFTYENGTITGLSASGKAKLAAGKTTLVIPATIGEESITKIGDMAFLGIDMNSGEPTEYADITSITISNGIEEIGSVAFTGTNITRIELPASIKTIGEECFEMSNLEEILFNEGLQTIANGAFAATKLTNVTLPEGVTTIGQFVFNGCELLTTINLPSTLTGLTYNSDNFSGCTSLTKIQINKTAEEIKAITGYPFADDAKNIIYDKDGNLVPYGE